MRQKLRLSNRSIGTEPGNLRKSGKELPLSDVTQVIELLGIHYLVYAAIMPSNVLVKPVLSALV